MVAALEVVKEFFEDGLEVGIPFVVEADAFGFFCVQFDTFTGLPLCWAGVRFEIRKVGVHVLLLLQLLRVHILLQHPQ